ncbi:MAG: anthranilate phosphoribosyltransferase [Rickettsiales bacterium]|nr:anthranilate phosphoribosyltransferase [Rickettsiales bacterium]
MSLIEYISVIKSGADLGEAQAESAFNLLVSGTCEQSEIVAFLSALRDKGESVSEIVSAARVLRQHMKPFAAPANAIDVCGTGGDAKGTYNISTAVAIVVAACGIPVAKHGNRSVSSKSGSSDVLSELGVNVTASEDALKRCLENANICFLMAPQFHPAMKHVAPARQEMGTRTIFNLLGPLCNPASVKRQMVGVYDENLTETLALVLKALGSEAALVVSSEDGMDELSVCGKSYISELTDGAVKNYPVVPEMFTLRSWQPDDLLGGDAAHNAHAMHELFDGAKNAYRDAVIMNASAALIMAECADDPESAAALTTEAIDSGRAKETLNALVEASQS